MRVTLIEVIDTASSPDRRAWINPQHISGVTEQYQGQAPTGKYIVRYGNWEVVISAMDWKKLAGTRCKVGG